MGEQEQTIDLRVLFRVLTERLMWIIVAGIGTALIAFFISSFVITKQYTSSAMLYVENSSNKSDDSTIDVNAINAAQKLVNTCQILFTNDDMLSALSDAFGGEYTGKELSKMISIESVNSTEMLRFSVQSPDPDKSKSICQKLVELSEAEFTRVIKGGSIEVVSNPTTPASHTFPNVTMFTIIGIVIGLLGSYFVFLIIEIFDTKVKDDDDLAQIYSIPVFAEIMDFESTSKAGYKYYKYDYSYGYGGQHYSSDEDEEKTERRHSSSGGSSASRQSSSHESSHHSSSSHESSHRSGSSSESGTHRHSDSQRGEGRSSASARPSAAEKTANEEKPISRPSAASTEVKKPAGTFKASELTDFIQSGNTRSSGSSRIPAPKPKPIAGSSDFTSRPAQKSAGKQQPKEQEA